MPIPIWRTEAGSGKTGDEFSAKQDRDGPPKLAGSSELRGPQEDNPTQHQQKFGRLGR